MRTLRVAILIAAGCWFAVYAARAAQLDVPERVTAGAGASIRTSGRGEATLYVVGPGSAVKRAVKLGEEIRLSGDELQAAGRYQVVLRGGGAKESRVLWVVPAKVTSITFLARPSRLPVALSGGISGVVYAFDKYQNLVTDPQPVKFELSVAGAPAVTHTVMTKNGVAWTRADSSRKEGAAQFVASVGEVSERRVVQQVASDPCNLRMNAKRVKDAIEVTTAPIRDCSGNPVPDGTIVTFTALTPRGKTTVDARIKRGIASAQLPASERAVISVASGVVMGNEVRIGGGQ